MTSSELPSRVEPAEAPQDLYWNGEGQAEQERRRYFRIEEQVILSFREVPLEEVPPITELRELPELPCNPFALTSSLELLSQESRSLMRRIERESPDIADCLKVIERKVDIIARTLMSRESDLTECPPREVNLSASGLSFAIDQTFEPGSVLEVKMVLLPNLVGVLAYGKVIYCRKNTAPVGPPYRIGVDFIGLSDQDRELLIRHVVRRQSQLLRSQKQGLEPSA